MSSCRITRSQIAPRRAALDTLCFLSTGIHSRFPRRDPENETRHDGNQVIFFENANNRRYYHRAIEKCTSAIEFERLSLLK